MKIPAVSEEYRYFALENLEDRYSGFALTSHADGTTAFAEVQNFSVEVLEAVVADVQRSFPVSVRSGSADYGNTTQAVILRDRRGMESSETRQRDGRLPMLRLPGGQLKRARRSGVGSDRSHWKHCATYDVTLLGSPQELVRFSQLSRPGL